MFYRVAIQPGRDQRDRPSTWQWKSTALSSLQSLFQVLRLYGALPQEHLRVFSSLSREGLEEQLRQENRGLGSSSVTAAQFLEERMIRSRGNERMTSIAPVNEPSPNKSSKGAQSPDERGVSSLEKRRVELERGAGGDHDIPYRFMLPTSMPQVLAWVKLLVKVQDGDLQP